MKKKRNVSCIFDRSVKYGSFVYQEIVFFCINNSMIINLIIDVPMLFRVKLVYSITRRNWSIHIFFLFVLVSFFSLFVSTLLQTNLKFIRDIYRSKNKQDFSVQIFFSLSIFSLFLSLFFLSFENKHLVFY